MLIELQKQILLFFSSIQSPVLNIIASFLSPFGKDLIPLAVGLFLYWCIDKKKGQICLLIATTSLFSMFLKAIIKFPRPGVLCPELSTIGIEVSEGYSFPSGHSAMTNCFYPTLYQCFKKTWLKIITVFLCVMVPVSRLYLCWHWPQDVIAGAVIGLCFSLLGFSFLEKFVEKIENKVKLSTAAGISVYVIGLIIAILLQFEIVDFETFSDITKLTAFSSVLLMSLSIETKVCNFSTEGSKKQKALRYLVGLFGLLFIMVGIKKLLPYIPIITYFRYTLTAVWACFYPLLGRKLKLFN